MKSQFGLDSFFFIQLGLDADDDDDDGDAAALIFVQSKMTFSRIKMTWALETIVKHTFSLKKSKCVLNLVNMNTVV